MERIKWLSTLLIFFMGIACLLTYTLRSQLQISSEEIIVPDARTTVYALFLGALILSVCLNLLSLAIAKDARTRFNWLALLIPYLLVVIAFFYFEFPWLLLSVFVIVIALLAWFSRHKNSPSNDI